MKRRIAALAAMAVLAACSETPTESVAPVALKPVTKSAVTANVYTSDATVTAWGPIYDNVGPNWAAACTANPAVQLNDPRWGTSRAASDFGTNAHVWQPGAASNGFVADWINAWANTSSTGGPGWVQATNPSGFNWTKYEKVVSGNGTFQLQLLADNCSWVYVDGTLVAVQPANWTYDGLKYGLTLNGTHRLTFLIFDGGGAAGGMFRLETVSNPPASLNPDLDGDGHPNTADAFPFDPTEWVDTDGDGHGDNGDAFPNDPLRWDAANLISNGSFERPVIGATWSPSANMDPWLTFGATNQGLPGWHVDASNVDVQSGEHVAQFTGVPDGVQVLDLNGAAISQSVATKAFYKYRVSFSLSTNYVCAPGGASVRVSFGGTTQNFTFTSGSGEDAQHMRWDAKGFDAIASGTASALQFTATAFGDCGGPMLDAVKVEEIGPTDVTPPSILPTITGTLGLNGWYTSNVSVTWAVTDPESTVSSTNGCDASSVTQDTNGVIFTCTATSPGGTDSKSVTVMRDASAPVITPTVTGTQGLGGWYTGDINVSWTTTDATSGVASTTAGCTAVTTSADNAGTTYTCSATNGAGLIASQSVNAKRDATKPTIGYSGNLGSYTVDQTVAITCAASDVMSGIASTTCANISGAAYAFTIGANNFSATAKDVAGNSNSASTSFTVKVTPASLCALVKRFVTKDGIAKSLCEQLVNGNDDKPEAGDDKKGDDHKSEGKSEAKSPTKSDLKDFREHVKAQSGKSMTAANANLLIALSYYL